MAEPSRRTSRLLIAGGAMAAIALTAGGFLLGRGTAKPAAVTPAPAPMPVVPAPEPPIEVPAVAEPPLGRAELIAAAARAADAFAAGAPPPAAVATLAGREFSLRIPFACPGSPPLGAGLSARYDEAEQALRLRAEPVRWTPEDWSPAPADRSGEEPAAEAVEGFAIARPWTSSESCPPGVGGATAMPAAPFAETLGIAQFYGADGSRVGRRDGKAFETVEKFAPEALDASRGFRLRLRGRIASAPGGGPVLCRGVSGPMQRPACLISVVLDEVAFENPADATVLATWDVSSRRSP